MLFLHEIHLIRLDILSRNHISKYIIVNSSYSENIFVFVCLCMSGERNVRAINRMKLEKALRFHMHDTLADICVAFIDDKEEQL